MIIYSLKEAAEILGVCPEVARRYIRSGKLPASKPGRDYKIRPEDLAACLERTRIDTPVTRLGPKPPTPPRFKTRVIDDIPL